jgi:hypothetical protein
MRYVLLVHFDPTILGALPAAERREVDRRSLAENDALARSGHLVHAEAIQEGSSARLVRVRDSRAAVTDGPYIETKEQMAGFVMLEARDLNEAIAIAARDYFAEIGTIEIRPIYEVADPDA